MTTWREAVAAKTERLRREGRYYTADLLGPVCSDPNCRLKVPKVLTELGITAHPTCGADVRRLVAQDKAIR